MPATPTRIAITCEGPALSDPVDPRFGRAGGFVVVNLETLAKNVDQKKVVLTKELIVFKLGLEAKSHKAVEISLNYLLVFLISSRNCFSSS